ncbi:MAG: hypothetical protein JOZ18_21220, partial [Chloroflexi bacterium]|nr:hypothetical protein [Chloroflexota bacterium]
MRQLNGSELFGANDPRSMRIGIIDVAPEDDRLSILTAILTQEKLGRQQTVVVLPDQNKAFHRSEDFEELQDTQRKLQTQIVIVASRDSNIVKFARQRGFSVFLSLENYTHYARTFLSQEPSREQAAEPVHEPDFTNDQKQQENAVPTAPTPREDDTRPTSPEPTVPEAVSTRPLPAEEVAPLPVPPEQVSSPPTSEAQALV